MFTEENLLIITKTYPMPSSDYREHTCVAAINDKGELRRLYPVPFRLLSAERQFKRWQWISAKIEKSSDKRPESHRIDTDSIKIINKKTLGWPERLSILRPHIFKNLGALEANRVSNGQSLGIIQPNNFQLVIEEEENKNWTESELANLTREGLFDPEEVKNRSVLKKMPYRFYYEYECIENGKLVKYRHLITDWEVGMLYFNCVKDYKSSWENKFREKLEAEFTTKKELFFIMGTVHRFPDQWLIVGLIYPSKKMIMQEPLFRPQLNA